MKRALALIVILIVLAGCVRPEGPVRPGPIRPRPTVGPLLTRVPAPIPRPTVKPDLAITTVIAPQWGLRAVSSPDAPVLLAAPESQVVNVVCVGDCFVGGGPSWVTSDVLVSWTHPDPAGVDEYEVWRATDEPYFDPDNCSACELAATTTGLSAVVTDSPSGFNPVGGTQTANIMSSIDTYLVIGRNAGGASVASNRVGAVSFSVLQGGSGPLE